jgi:hypothetical protein
VDKSTIGGASLARSGSRNSIEATAAGPSHPACGRRAEFTEQSGEYPCNRFPKLREQEEATRATAAQNFALANATLPESGLSGQDVVNLQLAQIAGKSKLAGQRAGLKAQKALTAGQFQSELIGAGVKGVTSVAGGLGGIGGGAGGATGGLLGVGGTGASLDVGQFGARSPSQQANFNAILLSII